MFQKPEESKKNSSADKTEKIREIYRFLLSETDYLKEIGKEIDEETERLLKHTHSPISISFTLHYNINRLFYCLTL